MEVTIEKADLACYDHMRQASEHITQWLGLMRKSQSHNTYFLGLKQLMCLSKLMASLISVTTLMILNKAYTVLTTMTHILSRAVTMYWLVHWSIKTEVYI